MGSYYIDDPKWVELQGGNPKLQARDPDSSRRQQAHMRDWAAAGATRDLETRQSSVKERCTPAAELT
ncbi:hypothetical protein ACLB2K_047248 [Fragaria x ananassa]